MNIKDIDNDKLNITEERKREIDNILKETEARVRSGEVKKNSLKEFDKKYIKRMEEYEELAKRYKRQMIFAISDIHGNLHAMEKAVDQIRPYLINGNSKFIMLGDYIDRGMESYECLKLAYDLQQEFGKDKVIVIKGNHEAWFIDFLMGNGDEWLAEDDGYRTTRTFLAETQMEELNKISQREEKIEYMMKTIKNNHKDLLTWVNKLPLYYETDSQIFVHAGVDEDIPEEEIEWCTLGTGEWTFLGKYPPSRGKFYKDIIAGHTAAKKVAGDKSFDGIYFDGESHFYIDGSGGDRHSLLCLAYDEEDKVYYDYKMDGTFKPLN